MKELVCNYALIRFLPYRETGEFVNIGVVLYAPEVNYFNFHLAEKRNRRVRVFFPELDRAVYAASVESLRRELERQRIQFTANAGLFAFDRAVGAGLTAFRSLLRRRESLLHFAEPGMRLGTPDEALDELYSEYILRSFAQVQEYQETVMSRRLGDWLKDWGLRKQYKADQAIGDEMFHLKLPFVHFDGANAVVAIKPLDLARPDATDVYDHGGMWVQRFGRLKERGHLPERTVVPVLLPGGPLLVAAEQILQELNDIGVQNADFSDTTRIHELARV